jgi:predicted ATPase
MLYTGSMRLNMLGGLGIESSSFNRPKPLLLLAYLAVEGSKEKRHLYELFWPEAADQATSLRMALSQLRKVDTDLFKSDERTVSTSLETDLSALQQAITERNADKLVELYKGEFLAGFSLPDWSSELEEWVYSTRDFIAARVKAAFLQIAEAEAAKGNFVEAVQWAEKSYLLGKDNHEPEDLGRLYPLLLAGDSSLTGEVKKQAKDYGLELSLTREEAKARYFVAVSKESTEPKAIPNNLPRAKTSFIGRDPELIEVGQMLHQSEVRLITLLGPGGMGKTRLALQLASGQLQEQLFADGIYFVALEALTEPLEIPLTLAHTLHLQAKDDPFAAVKTGIGNKRMLLVLDNFEHLTEGALLVSELLEACPKLSLIVTSRERLNLEEEFVLMLQGLPVPHEASLAEAEYNDAIKLFVQRAKRARLEFALTPESLPHVLSICKFVEGSPLGIELAAVWLRSLPIADIAREISKIMDSLETPSRNLVERHQSLRVVFEHSWKLLKPKEQQTLARLTVFIDGFTREAAGQVADATIPLLTSLVDKSLLRVSLEGRYDFHPLLYQYAGEKLEQFPEDKEQSRAKHAHYFLSLIEAQGTLSQSYLEVCQNEHQNLLSALAWSQEKSEAVFGLRLGYALARFWEYQGYASEGRQWLGIVLSHPGAAQSTEERAKALLYAGRIASRQSEHNLALTYGNEALAIAQAHGLEALAVSVYILLGNVANMQGDNLLGKTHAEAGLALARKLGDDELVATTLIMLGSLAEGLGEIDEAFALFEESLGYLRKLGRQRTPQYSLSLNNLGYMAWLRGDLKTAKATLEEALELARELQNLFLMCAAEDNLSVVMLDLGDLASSQDLASKALEYRFEQNDKWGMTFSLENFACLAAERTDAKRAALLWAAAERLREEIHAPMIASWQVRQEQFMNKAKRHLGEASFSATWQEGRETKLEQVVKYALEPEQLGPVLTPTTKVVARGQ